MSKLRYIKARETGLPKDELEPTKSPSQRLLRYRVAAFKSQVRLRHRYYVLRADEALSTPANDSVLGPEIEITEPLSLGNVLAEDNLGI